MTAVYGSPLDMIGNTPLVDVSPLSPNPRVRILAKIEGQNPVGSVKDRIALAMIEEAEKDGTLDARADASSSRRRATPASRSRSSARLKGYPIKIVLPENVSIERRQLLEIFGAEIILAPGGEGSNGAVRRAQATGRGASRVVLPLPVRQRGQPPGALRGHRSRDLAGLSRDHALRRRSRHERHAHGRRALPQGAATPTSRCCAVEPPVGEAVEGLRNLDDGFIPPVFETWGGTELLDGKRIVRPRESLEWTRRLMAEVGVFAGISSGAALAGAATGRRAHRRRRHRVHRLRRRLEVPVDRCLDRRPRRGRRARQEDHLLLTDSNFWRNRVSETLTRQRTSGARSLATCPTTARSACSTAGSAGSPLPGP